MPVTIDKSLPVPRIDRKRCDSDPSYQRYNTDTEELQSYPFETQWET